MGRPYDSRNKLLELLSDGKARGSRDVAESLDLSHRAAESVCYRSWKAGLLLRSEKPIRERNTAFAGRAGNRYNMRSSYLFILRNGSDETEVQNLRYGIGKPRIPPGCSLAQVPSSHQLDVLPVSTLSGCTINGSVCVWPRHVWRRE